MAAKKKAKKAAAKPEAAAAVPGLGVGRIVHFHEADPSSVGGTIVCGAMVVGVNKNGTPNLRAWPNHDGHSFHVENVPQGGPGKPDTWSWPPRV